MKKADLEVKLGFPAAPAEGAPAKGQIHPDSNIAIIDIAFYNIFGTTRIPARDALTPGTTKAADKLKEDTKILSKKYIDGEITLEDIGGILGAKASNIIKEEFTEFRTPANAPSTIAKKGSDNPLIDTGVLRNSITWEVSKK